MFPNIVIPEGMENIAIVDPNYPKIDQLKLLSATANLYNKRDFIGIQPF